MAADNKMTGVHFSMIVFAMLALICGVAFIVNWRELGDTQANLQQMQTQLNDAKTALRRKDEQIQRIKELLGYDGFEQIGLDDPNNRNTVLGRLNDDLKKFGGEQARGTVKATLTAMRNTMDNILVQNNELQTLTNEQQATIQSLRNEYQAMVDQHQQARQTAEANLEDRVQQQEELIAERDRKINELEAQRRQLQSELTRTKEAHTQEMEQKTTRINTLLATNRELQSRLDKVQQVSFERPDGKIRVVNPDSRLVWINLGRSDNLPEQLTFSVYTKNNRGMARGTRDIKGSIEVTRILGSDMAEARILENDPYRPITEGDPIYTPLWTSGLQQRFSFVGLIDFDNDGRSDRDRLHEIVQSAGAIIDNEVDEQGNLKGDGISVETKFLVMGKIPDPSQVPPGDKRQAAEKIQEQASELRRQAREQGVRIINLNRFLEYMGYRPTRRLWVPGEEGRYTLKAGARSTAVNETIGNRSSTGQASGIYGRSRDLPAPTSTGQTAFGGSGR